MMLWGGGAATSYHATRRWGPLQQPEVHVACGSAAAQQQQQECIMMYTESSKEDSCEDHGAILLLTDEAWASSINSCQAYTCRAALPSSARIYKTCASMGVKTFAGLNVDGPRALLSSLCNQANNIVSSALHSESQLQIGFLR